MFTLPNVDYGRDLNAKVTQDFTYGEFVSSMTAVRYEIENVPSDEEWQNIELLCRLVLQSLRDKIGAINITSGFRCKELNDAIESNDYSFHRFGCAVDIEPAEVDLFEGFQMATMFPFTELIAEFFPDGWIHIGYQKGRTDHIIKLKDDAHNYTEVSLKYIKEIYG